MRGRNCIKIQLDCNNLLYYNSVVFASIFDGIRKDIV